MVTDFVLGLSRLRLDREKLLADADSTAWKAVRDLPALEPKPKPKPKSVPDEGVSLTLEERIEAELAEEREQEDRGGRRESATRS